MAIIFGYPELIKELRKTEADYKEKICVESYGLSEKGRLLPVVKIGSGKCKLLAVAAVHSRELVTSVFLLKSLRKLLKNSSLTPVFSEVCLYLCLMANPDGVEIFLGRDEPLTGVADFKANLFKNNANNINLNANFPYCFSAVPPIRQGGAAAASQSETKALINLCEKECFNAMISLHARGHCVFYRDFGNGEIKGDFELAKSFEKCCGFELIAPTEKAEDYSGGFENWFRYRFKKPGLCIELVKDEKISFEDLCANFDKAVLWESTENLLSTFLCRENLSKI